MLLFLCCFNCVLWNMLYLWYAIHKQLLPPFSTNYIIYTTIQYQLYHIYHHSVPTKGLIRYAGLYHHDNGTTVLLNMEKMTWKLIKFLMKLHIFIFIVLPACPFLLFYPYTEKFIWSLLLSLLQKCHFSTETVLTSLSKRAWFPGFICSGIFLLKFLFQYYNIT